MPLLGVQVVIERLNTKAAILAVQDSGSHVASQLWFLQHLAAGCLGVAHACLQASLAACQRQPAWDLDPYLPGPAQACEGTLSPGALNPDMGCQAMSAAQPLVACQPQPA